MSQGRSSVASALNRTLACLCDSRRLGGTWKSRSGNPVRPPAARVSCFAGKKGAKARSQPERCQDTGNGVAACADRRGQGKSVRGTEPSERSVMSEVTPRGRVVRAPGKPGSHVMRGLIGATLCGQQCRLSGDTVRRIGMPVLPSLIVEIAAEHPDGWPPGPVCPGPVWNRTGRERRNEKRVRS